MRIDRRDMWMGGAALLAMARIPGARAMEAESFAPQPGTWRKFEITTEIEIAKPQA